MPPSQKITRGSRIRNSLRHPKKKRPKRKAKGLAAKFLREPLVIEDNHFRYSIHERLFHEKFDRKDVSVIKDMQPADFTLEMLLKDGFNQPIVFRNATPPGMRIPKNLTPETVLKAVGPSTKVEVINCETQDGMQMEFRQFIEYFTGIDKRGPRSRIPPRTYNLIDLEVSHTKLGRQLEAPALVRELDWAANIWPEDLRAPPARYDNEALLYPKTQKYVLLSKAGCFTDFHIDFGGSSVWYHLLQGKKIFFMMSPSEKNRNIYAQWVRSGQNLAFLGDEVDGCERIEVSAGDTLMIPSGWIHCVYTMDDSVVIGGNFLHSLNGEMQLDVALLEKALKVKKSIRYPFFQDLQWFVAQRYADRLQRCVGEVVLNSSEAGFLKALTTYLESEGDLNNCSIASTRITKPKMLLNQLKSCLRSVRSPKTKRETVRFGMNLADAHRESPEIAVPSCSTKKRAKDATKGFHVKKRRRPL